MASFPGLKRYLESVSPEPLVTSSMAVKFFLESGQHRQLHSFLGHLLLVHLLELGHFLQSGSLKSVGLHSQTTDFGAGDVLTALGSYRLGTRSLTLPISDLATYLQSGGLQSHATDFGAGDVLTALRA